MFFTRVLLLSSFVVAAFGAPVGVQSIESDISSIASKVNVLNKAIASFPASEFSGALNIHNGGVNLANSLASTTNTVKNSGGVSLPRAKAILRQLSSLRPKIAGSLQAIVSKKKFFDGLKVSIIVKGDLSTLHKATSAFWNAFIGKTPGSLKSQAQSIAASVENAFKSAEKAFA